MNEQPKPQCQLQRQLIIERVLLPNEVGDPIHGGAFLLVEKAAEVMTGQMTNDE